MMIKHRNIPVHSKEELLSYNHRGNLDKGFYCNLYVAQDSGGIMHSRDRP